jgi:hypothetical protein
MLAILFGALAPTVSHALAAAGNSSETIEICTVNGYKVVKLSGSDSSKVPSSPKHSMEHCAFCTIHGGSQALTSALFITVVPDPGRDIYPLLFYTAPQSLHAWSAAKPRGPPFLA